MQSKICLNLATLFNVEENVEYLERFVEFCLCLHYKVKAHIEVILHGTCRLHKVKELFIYEF